MLHNYVGRGLVAPIVGKLPDAVLEFASKAGGAQWGHPFEYGKAGRG